MIAVVDIDVAIDDAMLLSLLSLKLLQCCVAVVLLLCCCCVVAVVAIVVIVVVETVATQ